jgi:peptide chain release factor subunit 1
VLTPEVVRRLALQKGDGGPVVSLYLDVDGRRHVRPASYEAELERLLRRVPDHVCPQLQPIRAYVKRGFDRSHTRGVAVFSAKGLWETLELPVPVVSRVSLGDAPHVGPLEAVLAEHARFGVVAIDRQRARMLLLELGQVVDHTELFDQLPRHEDDKGAWRKDQVHDHAATAAHSHVRRAATATFEMFKAHEFDHLVLVGADDVTAELERELHSYLRARLAARLSMAASAKESAIVEATAAVEVRIEHARQAALVERMRAGMQPGRNEAVAGLDAVLTALSARRVGTLLVSDGYAAEGWRCSPCAAVAAQGPACPQCAGSMARVDDVVEEAIDAALNQSCDVVVCAGNADLDVAGRVGALLRF